MATVVMVVVGEEMVSLIIILSSQTTRSGAGAGLSGGISVPTAGEVALVLLSFSRLWLGCKLAPLEWSSTLPSLVGLGFELGLRLGWGDCIHSWHLFGGKWQGKVSGLRATVKGV